MSIERLNPENGANFRVPRTTEALTFVDLYEGRPHYIARTEINAKMARLAETDRGLATIARAPVPDDIVDWAVAAPGYRPLLLDVPRGASSARKEGDNPDPSNPADIAEFVSIFADSIQRDTEGWPLNPMGRTGIQGRGMLDKWGETPAADLLVSRFNPQTGELEVAAVQREDTGEWALPGGKAEPGETPAETAVREFTEEACDEGIDIDLTGSRVVFSGYMDDSRNTDNAWMAGTCIHKHLTPAEAEVIVLRANSDAMDVAWVPPGSRFFASHGEIVRAALVDYMA